MEYLMDHVMSINQSSVSNIDKLKEQAAAERAAITGTNDCTDYEIKTVS